MRKEYKMKWVLLLMLMAGGCATTPEEMGYRAIYIGHGDYILIDSVTGETSYHVNLNKGETE